MTAGPRSRELFAEACALFPGGVYWVPSQFEAAFLSAAHREAELSRTEAAASAAFAT